LGTVLNRLGRLWWTIFCFWADDGETLFVCGVIGELQKEDADDSAACLAGRSFLEGGLGAAGMAMDEDMIADWEAREVYSGADVLYLVWMGRPGGTAVVEAEGGEPRMDAVANDDGELDVR
jgi:hypothetical protein